MFIQLMFSSKKNKHQPKEPDGIVGSPGRSRRKLIGASTAPILKEDPTSRRLGDFSRPSGYHPSQPLVSSRLADVTSKHEAPSAINMTPFANLTPKEPAKDKSKGYIRLRRIKRGVLVLIAIALAVFVINLISRLRS